MIKTQAKDTKALLTKASNLAIKAKKDGKIRGVESRIKDVLNGIPAIAAEGIQSLAKYENEYSSKKLTKYLPTAVDSINKLFLTDTENKVMVSTGLNTPPRTLNSLYKGFAAAKTKQYMQIIRDSEVQKLDNEEFESIIEERTDGMFSFQNLALAGLAIVGTANTIRNEISNSNDLQVDWVLDLELNNCSYCEDMANSGPYNPEDVDGEIPAHANCGCTLIPLLPDADFED